jgi:hypothetical protein
MEGLSLNPITNELEAEASESGAESAIGALNFVDLDKFSDKMNLRQAHINFLSRQIYACIPEAVSVSLDSAYDDADSTGGASSH